MQYGPQKRISILLVDDHELVRAGIARLLEDEADMQVVGQRSSGEQALEYLSENQDNPLKQPDIIIMDARMPGLSPHYPARK